MHNYKCARFAMKTLKIITGIISIISALTMVAMPVLSSHMQSFYKSQTPAVSAQLTKGLLDKKQFWVQIGESNIFVIVFIACLCLFLTALLFDFIIKKTKL